MPKIEDFGEKIGGARKDLYKLGRELRVDDITAWSDIDREKYITKNEVFPRPDYEKLYAEGMDREVLFFIKRIRDALPSKPETKVPYNISSAEEKRNFLHGEQEKYIRSVGEIYTEALELKTFKQCESFYDQLRENEKIEAKYINNRKFFRATNLNGKFSISWFYRDLEKKQFLYSDSERKLSKYSIFYYSGSNVKSVDMYQNEKALEIQTGNDGRYYSYNTGELGNLNNWRSDTYFALDEKRQVVFINAETKQQLQEKLLEIENANAASASSKKRKGKFTPPQLVHIRPTKQDYRQGRDITGEDMMSVFGFRAGEFGNWETDNDKQANLNMSYDAFKDLAKALDISDKDVSLGGKLAIAYGSRGIRSASAHFEPGANVINLTKMNGAGSLGHEWGHALDFYISQMMGYSSIFSSDGSFSKNNIMHDLMDTIKYTEDNKRTKYLQDAMKLDSIYSKDAHGYWQSNVELFARAFASYVHDKLEESDYLIGHSEAKADDETYISPQGEERKRINLEFDSLINNLKERKILTKRYTKDMTDLNSIESKEFPVEQITDNIPDEIRENAKKSLVVNLYGGPGAGKSTTALQLVAELKKQGLHAEYVSEVAKELVYAKAFDKLDGSLENQKKILAEQKNRLDMIAGNVDVAVTDSPLMLNTVYLKEQSKEHLSDVLSQYNEYNNFNILISRDTSVPFENEGRIHNLEESMEKDGEILSLLESNNIEFERFDRDNIDRIAKEISQRLLAETDPKGVKEYSDIENETDKNSLFSIEQNGERREYINNGNSIFDLMNIASGENAYAALIQSGNQISSENFAEIQQSNNFAFSAEFNFDENEVRIYKVNGNVPEPYRTDENSSIKTYNLDTIKELVVEIISETSDPLRRQELLDQSLNLKSNDNSLNVNLKPENSDKLFFQFKYSDNKALYSFLADGYLDQKLSFAMANSLVEYLDQKQHAESLVSESKNDKTIFQIQAVIDGEDYKYEGRIDLGDGGGDLIEHIRHSDSEEIRGTALNILDVLVPFLEAHSELTPQEQEIFDSFVKANPIRDESYIEARRIAEEQNIPFSEYYSDGVGEEFNPYAYDGSMSPEDFRKMQLLNTLSDITKAEDDTPYKLIEAFEKTAAPDWKNNLKNIQDIKYSLLDILNNEHLLTENVYTAISESDYINERLYEDSMDKAIVAEDNFSQVIDSFNEHYDEMYQNRDKIEFYAEAVAVGDKFIKDDPDFVAKLAEQRRDIVSSDRETAALAFALADVGLIEKFTETEISEPEKTSPDTVGELLVQNGAENITSALVEQSSETPTITCEWSESNIFEDGKTYSVAEFDSLMKQADDERIAGQKAAIEKYGSAEAWYNSDVNDEFTKFKGYDKTKFTVNMPNGTSYTERQDIGDGFGGVIDFLNRYSIYNSIIPELKAAREIQVQEQSEKTNAENYAKKFEKHLSEEKRLMDIGNEIDKIILDSKVGSNRYDLIGARKEIKARFQSDEIKSCLAMSVMANRDHPRSDKDCIAWAKQYCSEHNISTELSAEDAPCKTHLKLINAFIKKSINPKELYKTNRNEFGDDNVQKEKVTLTVDENDILLYAEKIKLNKAEDESFAAALDELISGDIPVHKVIDIGKTPNVLKIIGVEAEKLTVNQSVIKNSLNAEDVISHGHTSGHGLTADIIKQLPSAIRNPIMICSGSKIGTLVAVTELKDKNNKNVIASITINVLHEGTEISKVTSVYGKNNINNTIEHGIIAVNKEKASKLGWDIEANSSQSALITCFDNSIAYTDKNVKRGDKNFSKSVTVTQAEKPEIVSFRRSDGKNQANIRRGDKSCWCNIERKNNDFFMIFDDGNSQKLDDKQVFRLYEFMKNGSKSAKSTKSSVKGIKL